MMLLKEKQGIRSASSAFSIRLILAPIITIIDLNIFKIQMLTTTHMVPTPTLTLTTEGPMVRRGEPPSRPPGRFRTMRRVDLFQGNLVLDCPVPPRFLNTLPNKKDHEFTHMRYTAATCDPSDFKKERFTLRQVLYEQPRATEMFIVITLYNEDEVLFARTMHGVMKNIAHLCSGQRSKVWDKEGWRKVVVCVVADGRTKCDPAISYSHQDQYSYSSHVSSDGCIPGWCCQKHRR